jgi:hypothetical protein
MVKWNLIVNLRRKVVWDEKSETTEHLSYVQMVMQIGEWGRPAANLD